MRKCLGRRPAAHVRACRQGRSAAGPRGRGYTPLQRAATNDCVDAAKALLAAGASLAWAEALVPFHGTGGLTRANARAAVEICYGCADYAHGRRAN